MWHDALMKSVEELKRWHDLYNEAANVVGVALRKFLEVLDGFSGRAHSTKSDIHAVPQMLLYEFAECIDGVTILVQKGSAKNCTQLMRSAFELDLSIRYIMEDDASYAQRSLAYECFHFQDRLKWTRKCDPDDELGKQIRSELVNEEFADVFNLPQLGTALKDQIYALKGTLQAPRYKVVRDEIERISRTRKEANKKGGTASNWYSLWHGPSDVRSLARKVKRLTIYEVMYRSWSNVAHGEGALKRIIGKTDDERVNLVPLRSPVDLLEKCVHTCQLTNALTMMVVEKCVPDLRNEWKTWYAETMKPAFSTLKNSSIVQ